MRKMKISMGLAAIAGLGYAADVLVDLAVDPPEATSPEGMVVGAERTRDGVALSLECPEDSEFSFMWCDPADEVPGDDFFWCASALGVPLMYGSGLEVPLSDCPLADELEFMVPGSDADWTGLDKASSPMARQALADRGGFVGAGSYTEGSDPFDILQGFAMLLIVNVNVMGNPFMSGRNILLGHIYMEA